MKLVAGRGCNIVHQLLLRGASLLVPVSHRGEWLREWRAELWHLRNQSARSAFCSWREEFASTRFCSGAFQDALFFRREFGSGWKPFAPLAESPSKCLLFLCALLAACYLFTVILPGVRAERSLAWSHAYADAVLIRNARANNNATPTISFQQFRQWDRDKGKYFEGFAFYRVAQPPIALAGSAQKRWHIAFASSNLFDLLSIPVRFEAQGRSADRHLYSIVLSDEFWRRDFGGDVGIAGSILRIGNRDFRIAGVAPRGAWRFPEKVDAWVLEPDSAIEPEALGFVVAQLSSKGRSEMWAPRQLIKTYGPHNSEEDYLGVLLDEQAPPPWAVFLFGVLLALLALPATACVSMSEFSRLSHKPSWSRRFLRWGFMGGKVALLVLIDYFVSLDMSYTYTSVFSPYSVYLHLATSFSICLLGLSWACRDQRQRCPVCLRRVTHATRVGVASQTFLGWSGTELICAGGHTLLHIPALPTSWFSTQRWLYLDGSWEFLFTGS